jgi:hypothetical protein
MSVKFCTESLDISQSQLAALLSVRPETLESYKNDLNLWKQVSFLASAITVIKNYGFEGKEILNLLNETLDDGDCILGKIVGNSDGHEIYAAIKEVVTEYVKD